MSENYIFINLKRFDVPKELGGVCPIPQPGKWVQSMLQEVVALGLGKNSAAPMTVFFPESLLLTATETIRSLPTEQRAMLSVGCQGVFGDDVKQGGNFGALTSSRSAKAMAAIGCTWTMIGHSEERRALLGVLAAYDPEIRSDADKLRAANTAVNALLCAAIMRAGEAGLNVLFCVGETAEEKGNGTQEEQAAATRAVLQAQIEGVFASARVPGTLAIGYEPIWAIGPGKTPPGQAYIRFALDCVRDVFRGMGREIPPVVYGGGLKEDNAALVAQAGSDGGLIALTRFSGDIGFYPSECAAIVAAYMNASTYK